MSAGPDQFDLDAAMIRRSESELRAFMAALAVRLEGALGNRVTVERRRDGLLSGTKHVAKISIRGDKGLYELSLAGTQLTATRAKLVRGVTISSAAIAAKDWLAEVRREVEALAAHLGGASDVLHEFI